MSRPGGFRPFQPLGASATSNVTTGAPKRPRPQRCRARGGELRAALASPASTGEGDIAAVGDAIAAFELPKAMLEAALAESKAARLRRMA